MNESNQTASNFQAALDAGKALGSLLLPTDRTQVVIVPNGYTVKALEPIIEQFLDKPRRVKACVSLDTIESFIQYVEEFQLTNTRIFALTPQSGAPKLVAIIDYHDSDADNEAEWCQHRAIYAPGFTEEWSRWMGKNKVKMGQEDFAFHLEENLTSVTNPPGTKLLELVQELHGKSNVACSGMVRLNNGAFKATFSDEVELKAGGEEITFPAEMEVTIPPFDGGAAYKIKCRLRYRVESRRLSFWYECVDLHLVLKDAVDGINKEVEAKLKIQPLLGTPPQSAA